ncbi:SSS family transporter [Haloferula luteola]|uniref:SSS family transporter n=1 Tax=Haloferula luteola TaxID=595692 RepID=A0A840UYG4_9BACT|nr:sodium/solute symporter [Haloferula luteola]MBB5351187.1 SSS family transporter [Haloferula luteola]
MFIAGISIHFTWIDWLVLFGYLGLCTWIGHRMSGAQATIRDFFLGGRSLPWPAVTGSIIATEISGVTFVGVPGTLFALEGDFTYLQWAIGSIFARFLVAKYLVPLYYEQEIYSPYDYMGRRLGRGAKTVATVLFTAGSILGQSVRVLVAAIPLKVVTGMPIETSILIIGLFAIAWTLMGGMRTVIWTDVMQFVIFALGGAVALVWIVGSLQGGWGEFWETASRFGRTRLLDFTPGFRAELEFTFWVALLAVPFQNLTSFGVDQLNAQRMFCCRNAKDASKALIFSCFGQVLTLLMLMVGAALFVHYHVHPFTADEAALVKAGEETVAGSAVRLPAEGDYVFPMWIVTMLPTGLSGLLLAGVFAASISSLDSILAALSQTTLSVFYHPEDRSDEELEGLNLVWKSRMLVIFWGVLLTGFTLLLNVAREGIPILPLAFGMTSYTVGPLLGIMACAVLKRGSVLGVALGSAISFLLVALIRPDFWVLLSKAGVSISWLAPLHTFDPVALGAGKAVPLWFYGWAWPVTAILTFAVGCLVPRTGRSA